MKKIPVYEPILGQASRDNVIKCLESNWISSRGEFIEKFEEAFCQEVGCKYASSVSNGTVALHLALLALGVGKDVEVIVPTFTYIAPVNAINYVGAKPVFVDSMPDTWQMDPAEVEAKITSRTAAIIIVHLYGHPADNDAILAVAGKHNIAVIEDCAEAFGSYIGNFHVGNHGDISTFSFFGNKTITTGEGGMVVTNDSSLNERVRKFKGQGLAGSKEYWHDVVGYNYRMTNICAAIGLGQLELSDQFISKKRQIATKIRDSLVGLPLEILWEKPGVTNSFWMVTIATIEATHRDALRYYLLGFGIETRPAFYPAHTMPMYKHLSVGDYPKSIDLAARGINLPSSPALTESDIDYVISKIRCFFEKDA